MQIPFSKVSMAGNEYRYLKEVLESGWLTTFSKALEFEKLFAEYVGARFACAVNSCTSALHLAVDILGIRKGDKVLVPSFTFASSAEVIRYMGADPIFMDVDYETGIIAPHMLEEILKRQKNIKALILVHYGGQAALMRTADGNGIMELCRKYHVKLIEDAAHAFPTKFEGQYIGSFGDITCFSFYANKTITTGEGGMLVTNDEGFHKQAKVMRLHGINRDIWNRYSTRHSSWEYDIVAAGYKYNMPDINAAVGLAQLERAEYFRQERQRCAEFYFKELKDIPEIDLPVFHGSLEDQAWHLFPIKILANAPVNRDSFIVKMGEYGIGTSVHYKPLHRMSYYRDSYGLVADDFPNTERIWKGLVSLPIYPVLSNDELMYICQTIRKLLK